MTLSEVDSLERSNWLKTGQGTSSEKAQPTLKRSRRLTQKTRNIMRRGLGTNSRLELSTQQFLSRKTAENELKASSISAQGKLGGGGGTNANVM